MTTKQMVRTFEGIYGVPEAARYLLASRNARDVYRVKSRHLVRWIRRGLALPTLAEVPGREMLITFQDLVSLRVIAALRSAGVSFPKIRAAHEWLRQHTEEPRPFATEVLWTERSEVFTELQERLIAASRHGQLAMEMLRQYIIPVHGLTFGEDRVATCWEPTDGVLLHPLIQFGSPCVKGTRVPTRTVWGMVEAGDPPQMVAESFRLTMEDVDAALRWEESLAA
jgi:uncharacterized protein (DUF433 family)/DNA-binding transcriptional MerR regulator